jgi:methylthioribose-1-phosphate isomerase
MTLETIPAPYFTLRWNGGATGTLTLIDQTLLPEQYAEIECRTVEQIWDAIKVLRVRGAPAIGVSAAYGVILGAQTHRTSSLSHFQQRIIDVADYLATSRPTAVNLFWALARMKAASKTLAATSSTAADLHDKLFDEAIRIDNEDRAMCEAIGLHGSGLLSSGMTVLTHCNAGGLATAGDGTALSVMFAAAKQCKSIHVFADETRPLLQGARLTAWELQKRNIPVTLICDNMAAQVMKEGRVHMVITGADRIAANGDSANKIGTYGVAVLAKHHGIPFCIAAPSSTFDLAIPDGSHIPIEQRASTEITHGFGRQTAPDGIAVYNPAFDVTPADLIHAIITEHGVIFAPTSEKIREHLAPRES